MKICMVTDTFWPRINGVSVSISSLTHALRTLGHEVYIAAPDYSLLPTRRTFIDGDSAPFEGVVRFPSHSLLFFPEDCLVRFAGRDYLRQRNQLLSMDFDIIHTHTPVVLGILAMNWQQERHVPLVHTFHTLFEDFMPHYFPLCYMPRRQARSFAHWLSLNTFHWYCNHFDCVIAPSTQVAEVLRSYYVHSRVEVVPTGIETEKLAHGDGQRIRRAWGVGPEEKLLLFVGRVCAEKSVALLVRAMVHILAGEPAARLAIVGRGPAEDFLHKLAHDLGVAERIYFAGYHPHPEMADIYAAADLFVIASQTETQGLVTVEALAAGTPVVAVRGPGTTDLLEGEQGGLLCGPDEVELARQVLRLLHDPALYAQKAAQTRRRAEAFSSLAMGQRMAGIYESLLRQPARVRRLSYGMDRLRSAYVRRSATYMRRLRRVHWQRPVSYIRRLVEARRDR